MNQQQLRNLYDELVADIFTKPLVEDRFNFIKEKLLIMKNPNKG